LQEFQALLIKSGFVIDEHQRVSHPQGKRVVLVGDLIDKGYAVKEVIEFAYINRDVFYMVIGNHENFVYKALKGIFKKSDMPSQDIVNEYFSTYYLLSEPVEPKVPREPVQPDESTTDPSKFKQLMQRYEKAAKEYEKERVEYEILSEEYSKFSLLTEEEKHDRRELKEKFFAVCEAMKSFYVHKDFIVTHAPCESKYLGKISADGLRATRDFRYPKRESFPNFAEYMHQFDEHTKFVREDSDDFYPIHVFGHVMTKEMSRFKNKINIDTGCVAGGELTAIQIVKGRIFSDSVKAGEKVKTHNEQLHNFFY
jgi:hypothetical protein